MIGAVAAVAGKPVTISGYAQDFSGAVARVCFSGDGGATWTAYEVVGADPNRNVNWSFSFVPPEEGAYELLVRAERADGSATPEPARVHVVAGPGGA